MKERRDNLKKYRNERVEINTKLIKKAIDNIISMSGELSANNVSRTTYLVADSKINEKGISPSAISKNKIYKSLIQEAIVRKKTSKGSFDYKTDGDIRIELFQIRVEKEKLIKENLLLKGLLKKYGGDSTLAEISQYQEIEKIELIKQATKGLVNRLFELELAEYNASTGELVLAQLHDVLLSSTGYKLIIGDEND